MSKKYRYICFDNIRIRMKKKECLPMHSSILHTMELKNVTFQ